jgi:hypothetical protein
MPTQQTYAAAVLARHPEIRDIVERSDEFRSWKDRLPSVVVDGVRYYVHGGDQLQDEDQLALDWTRRKGLLTENALASEDRAAATELPPDVETVALK